MWIQRMIWFLGRFMFYTLLVLLLGVVIYTLAHDQWLAGLISLILSVAVIHLGLVRLRIPAYSVVVRDDRVVFFIPEKTVRNRFDFVSRGQSIVELPQYGLLDRPFKLEIFSPDNAGSVFSCRLSLHIDYLMETAAWQRAYESFLKHQDRLPMEVKRLLLQCSSGFSNLPDPVQGEEAMQEYLKPFVADLDKALEFVGLRISTARCSFFSGSTIARFVAGEQESLGK